MNGRLQFGMAIPQTLTAGPFRPDAVGGLLQRAEALGLQSAWVVDQVLGTMPTLAPVELLAFAAAVTTRLRLGAAVLLTALRSPVHLARTLATLDHLSGGRLVVGVGLGGNPRVYPAFGLTSERRVARFVEGLQLVKRLWTEPRVTHAGAFWTLEDAAVEPKPLQRPHPPLWFGGHHPRALQRTVELGDGFIGAGSIGTTAFAAQVRTVRALLAERGRDPDAFPVAKRVYLAFDPDRDRAVRRLGDWFGAFYGRPQLAAEVSVWGGPQACLDGLAAVAAAGARLLILNPVFDEGEQLEALAATVLPRL